MLVGWQLFVAPLFVHFYLQSQLLHLPSSMNTQKGEYQLKVAYTFTFRTWKRSKMIQFTFAQTFTEGHPKPTFDLQRDGKEQMLIYSQVIIVVPTRQQLLQNYI